MKKFISCILMLALATPAMAATKIGFRNFSAAGQTNVTVTCNVMGVGYRDPFYTPDTGSMRSLSLTKGGMQNYSTALAAGTPQVSIACVNTKTGAAAMVKMFFDGVETRFFPISTFLMKF